MRLCLFRPVLRRLAALMALALPLPCAAAGQAAPALRARAAEVSLSGRVQTQLNTTSAEDEPASVIFLRRVRLEARVKVNDLVSGKIQPDFAGDRLRVKDAYLVLHLAPAVNVLAGQAHRPFSLLTRYSSLRMPPVEKGAELRGVEAWDQQNLVRELGYSSRDLGVQLLGEGGAGDREWEYALALLQGPLGGRVPGRHSWQWVARGDLRLAPDLSIGAAWSRRHFLAVPAAPAGPVLRAGEAGLVSLAYDPALGAFAIGEATVGAFDPLRGERFRGAQLWLGYRAPGPGAAISRWEPIFRASYGDVDREPTLGDELGGTLLTPGVNVYFGGLNRLMLNYDLWLPAAQGQDTAGSFKAMFQLVF